MTNPWLTIPAFWIGWEGAVLRAKLVKNKKPLQIFQQQFFARLQYKPN